MNSSCTNLLKSNSQINNNQARQIGYQSNDLWKSVLSVSSQGSKKGRGLGKRQSKDLNIGQNIGDGKLQVRWPGLNTNIMVKNTPVKMEIIGEDEERDQKLKEVRDQMERFGKRKTSCPPHERGFTSATLKGKSIGEPTSYDDVDFSEFDTKIVDVKMVMVNKSILGKKKQCSVFVVTGNRNGVVGYGFGKGPMSGGAIRLARIHASQRLLYINRYEDRTLFHNFYEEFYFTKVYAEKMPAGYGLKCHRIIKLICELVGIKDLYAKVEGSRNAKNIAKAFISGLLNSKKYADIANEKKLHVVEYKPECKYKPIVLASPVQLEVKLSEESDGSVVKKAASQKHDTDLNLYLFNNKIRKDKMQSKPFYAEYPSYKKYLEINKKEMMQKKARLERYRLLDDDHLAANCFPRKKAPKSQEEAEN